MMARQIDLIDRLSEGGWLNGFLTFIAGASMIGAYAPFSYWLLIFPGLIWFILPLQHLSIKQTLYRGLYFNIGFFTFGITWVHISIHRFGNAPLPISIPLTALLVMALSLFASLTVIFLNRYFSRLSNKLYYLVALPFCWILFEWISTWIFTGFPWFNLSHSQVDGFFSAVAPVMGSAAISFLIVLLCGIIALTLREGGRVIKLTAMIFTVIVITVGWLDTLSWVDKSDKTLTVSLIQPNIAQDKKWLPEERKKTLRYFQTITQSLDSQLIIWPEGAVPALARQVQHYLQTIDEDATYKSQSVLTGIPIQEGEKYYNATIMLGIGSGKYYKQHLLPFGEYVPFESALRGLIDLFDLPMSSFSSGEENQPLLETAGWKFTMAICYEIIFQDVVASQLAGAELLVTLSNDAWFGDSIGVYQHLEIARMRALENGIPVIRATNDGVSALIDHKGVIQASMGKFEKGTLSGVITAVNGETPFRQMGPFWSYFLLLLVPGLVLLCYHLYTLILIKKMDSKP